MLAGLVLVLAVASGAWAASEKVLYAFHGTDGWAPSSLIRDSRGNLYGATIYGGTNTCPGTGFGCGVVFRLARGVNGKWRETVLHNFGGRDGEAPVGSLVSDRSGNLYGVAVVGGDFHSCSNQGCGLVFELVPGGDGKWTEKVLHAFDVTDRAWPFGGLIFDSAGNLYGTASIGGGSNACTGGCGVVFKLSPSAGGQWTETVLHSFGGVDGETPLGAMAFDSIGDLYGTTELGGDRGWGTVFELTPAAGGTWTERVLHSFDQSDGAEPGGSLIFDAPGSLYGTTPLGGPSNWGTVFKLAPSNGGEWKETVLHYFDEHKVEGGDVSAGLVFDATGNLYGTAAGGGKYKCSVGGSAACGVVFRLAPQANGKWAETVLHSFGKGSDGAGPSGDLIIDSAGHLFGMTGSGGYVGSPCEKDGCGVVFEVTP
jgi:uncharacterized repeat protein (TIGR03803 family)